MGELGSAALAIGIGLSAYVVAASVAGKVWNRPQLSRSAQRALYMCLAASLTAGLVLVYSFVTNDFSIRYVYEHSNLALDRVLTWVAFYAGNEGSLLYILIALGVMSSIAVRWAPKNFGRSVPYVVAILAGIQIFYFVVLLFFANPFEPLGRLETDGLGLNPLLEHPGMFSHPPLLMAGLAGIAIPFSFSAAALLSRNTGDDWVNYARSWGIVVWAILGTGLLVGAWWAYTILGWGGYWSWDPIENVALMPWLVMTAFIHSVMVQKRRGMFRMWNIVLLNIAFGLAQLGMFINRGGTVVSVHSFAESALGLIFLSFMITCLTLAFALFIWRYPILKSDRSMESFLSREASFLVNNFLLLAITASVLWGVIFPLISGLARDVDVTIAAPYFNRTAGPMLLVLLFVMGVGPLLSWRKTSGRSLRLWMVWPSLSALSVAVGLVATGIREPLAVVAFAVIAFVFGAIMEEWWRGVRVRVRAGDNPLTGWWRMINGNRPRHGGYIVHLAVLALAIGVTGTQFFDQRTDAAISVGQSAVFDNYRIEYVSHNTETRSDRFAQWAQMSVFRINPEEYTQSQALAASSGRKGFVVDSAEPSDRFIGEIRAWHGFYPSFNQISVRSGIYSTPLEDLYVIPRDFLQDGRVSLAVSINPLAMWLWIAGPIFLLGTAIALMPHPALERKLREASSRLPILVSEPG